jgi:LysR family transcriptional regulator, benzoate and cis,cis-muconate-responsive activator of ben and cat genes
MTPTEQFRALEGCKIDLGFVCFRARPTGSDLQWACVGHDTIMAAVVVGSPLARKAKIDLKDLEPMFFVGMSEKVYPGSNEWLIETCREAGFTPRILQDADREPAVISFVAAGLGVAFCCRNRLKGSLTKA